MARCCFHFLSLYICACFYLKIQYMFLKRAFLKLERHVFWTYSNTQQTYFRKKKTYSQYPSRWPILQSSLTVRLRGANPSNMVSDVSFFYLFKYSYLNIPEVYQEIQEWLYFFFIPLVTISKYLYIYIVIHVGKIDLCEFYFFFRAWKKTWVYTILLLGFGKFLDV